MSRMNEGTLPPPIFHTSFNVKNQMQEHIKIKHLPQKSKLHLENYPENKMNMSIFVAITKSIGHRFSITKGAPWTKSIHT